MTFHSPDPPSLIDCLVGALAVVVVVFIAASIAVLAIGCIIVAVQR